MGKNNLSNVKTNFNFKNDQIFNIPGIPQTPDTTGYLSNIIKNNETISMDLNKVKNVETQKNTVTNIKKNVNWSDPYAFSNAMKQGQNNTFFSHVQVELNNYNSCFNEILKGKIASNSQDAKNGKFINSNKINSDYWGDKKLTFDKMNNGSYLISIITPDNKKMAMGFTDAATYTKYCENLNLESSTGRDLMGNYTMVKNADGNYTKYYDLGAVTRVNSKGYPIKTMWEKWENNPKNSNTKTEQKVEPVKSTVSDKKVQTSKPTETKPKEEKVETIKAETNNNTTETQKTVEPEKKEEKVEPVKTTTTASGDLSKYNDTSATVGSFTITNNNSTFSMSEDDKIKVAAIVYGEAVEGSPADALGVASVMANRADSGRFGSSTLVGVATAANQFHAYNGGKYNNFVNSYRSGNLNPGMKICLDAVTDVMNGIRNNNNYLYFTGHGSYTKYR